MKYIKLIFIFLFIQFSLGQTVVINSFSHEPSVSYIETTVTDIVSASNHDAETRLSDGNYTITSTDLELADDTGNHQRIGMYFNVGSIPSNAIIDNATIQFTAERVTTGAVDLTISAQKSSTPTVFAAATNDLKDRTATTTEVTWSPADWSTLDARTSNEKTINFASVITEVIQGGSYVAGDPIVIFIEGDGVDSDYRAAVSWDNTPADAPEISITYRTIDYSAIYDNLDAANPVAETNSASGWNVDTGSLSVASVSGDTTDGTYALEFTHSSTTQQETMTVYFPVESGASYTVTVDSKRVVGANWEMWLRSAQGWTTNTGTVLSGGNVGSWGSNSRTGTTDDTTAAIRIGTTSVGATGWKLLLDNIRVVKNP